MFSRRHFALLATAACLLLASGAAAAVPGSFSTAIAPTDVKPTTSGSYSITLTNSPFPMSETSADRAKIQIPPGFSAPSAVEATTSAARDCVASTWVADVSGGTINLRWPGGNTNRLCPGGTLTVAFSATSPAAEGEYTWVPELLRGEDEEAEVFTLAGNPPSVRVDGTAPTVSIGQRPSNPSNSRSATFSFAVSELLGARCKLDNAPFAPCTSPLVYDNLSDGSHTFTVASTDAAGNTGQDSYTWAIETRAPAAAVSSGPAALSNTRSATFGFSADEPSSFQCQLDGGSFLPCTSPAAYHGLGDGAHTFAVRPTDAVGNGGATATYPWRIDATAPETTIGSAPRSQTTTLSATFRFSASESAAFQCKRDAGAFVACTSPKTYAGLSRSAHRFEVRATDTAGNADPTSAVHRWTIAAATRTVKTTSALLAPQAGARVTSPPVLRWRRVAKASYYNVQLYRGQVKVLSTWPTGTRIQLRTQWTYLGQARRLAPGNYRWYVWPGYGQPSARRYGRLLGESRFTVSARR